MIGLMPDALGYRDEDRLALGTPTFGGLYTEEGVLRLERERLFSRSWSIVTTTDALANTGDYVTAEVAGAPLVIVRDDHGALRAHHNVCRHRGITLVEGQGSTGRFLTCPYHQWSYRLGGELATVPQEREQFADLDRCSLGLHPAQVAEWHGMVFANPSVTAPAFSEAMAGLDRRLESFLSGPLHQVAMVEYEAACNWKLLVENHIDVYHLWYLHARSLAAYEHRSFQWESLGDNWWSSEPLKEATERGFAWLDPGERNRIGAHLLFPNLMLVTTDDYFATYDATPLTPDRTRLTLRVRATDDADAGSLVQLIRSFMAEDVTACERMQHAAASPVFGVGPMAATHEEPIRRFHSSLRRWVLA